MGARLAAGDYIAVQIPHSALFADCLVASTLDARIKPAHDDPESVALGFGVV
jgi:hypothetical protein